MPTEITATGYRRIRAFVLGEAEAEPWAWIAFREGASEEFRLPLSDSRITIVSDHVSNPIRIQATISGDDAEVNLPVTIDTTSLHDVDSGGAALSEGSGAPATLTSLSDQVTITHELQVPQIEE